MIQSFNPPVPCLSLLSLLHCVFPKVPYYVRRYNFGSLQHLFRYLSRPLLLHGEPSTPSYGCISRHTKRHDTVLRPSKKTNKISAKCIATFWRGLEGGKWHVGVRALRTPADSAGHLPLLPAQSAARREGTCNMEIIRL
ncbi:hypothetical protein B0H65DRAFT_452274, partial [Neurospora tetraspora]